MSKYKTTFDIKKEERLRKVLSWMLLIVSLVGIAVIYHTQFSPLF